MDESSRPAKALDYATPAGSRARPYALIGLAATTILAGAMLGAGTNAINGTVSPRYFVTILRWDHVADIWRASVAQGILEGLVFGAGFALIFTLVVGIVTRAGCTYAAGARCLLWIMAGACGCWVLGGVLAMGLASLSPDFYRNTFIGVPNETAAMLRYAWVGGSIWGVEMGGALSVAAGLVIFSVRWRRQAIA